jgi:hypothetical protein
MSLKASWCIIIIHFCSTGLHVSIFARAFELTATPGLLNYDVMHPEKEKERRLSTIIHHMKNPVILTQIIISLQTQ